jgi:hypothetical protein
MKKIFILFFIFGSLSSKAMERKPIVGYLALNMKKRPEIAGYPENSCLAQYSPKHKIQNSLNLKVSAEELLFPIIAWPEKEQSYKNPPAREILQSYPEHLDFETLKNLKDGEKIQLVFSEYTFILTARQTKDQEDPNKILFEEALRQQIKKALEGSFDYCTEKKELTMLIDAKILEQQKKKHTAGFEYHPLTAKVRKKYEEFLNNKQ